MTAAFDPRIVKVGIEIDGEINVFDNLRIDARGTKWVSALMSRCDLRIYNLSSEHQQYILTKASPIRRKDIKPINVTLDVGRESYGTFRLFEGAMFQGGVSQPPDIGIALSSLTNNFLLANTTAVSFPEYSTLQQICDKVAKDLGLSLLMRTTNPGKQISNYSFTGSPQKQVDKLNQMGVVAYVDNKVLIVSDPGQARSDEVIKINSATGMVGVPQPTESGCMVRMMIGQGIEVGCEVQVESEQNPAVNGNYIVIKLDYEVSNRDEPFFFTLECFNKDFYLGTI
jgi:hypothetical protein